MTDISANSKDNQITEKTNPIIMKAELTNNGTGEKQELTSEVDINSLENVKMLNDNNGEQFFVAEGKIYVEFNKDTMNLL